MYTPLTLKNILVPIDFSPPSRAALEYALRLAEALGASLEALHVWYGPEYVSPEVALHSARKRGNDGLEAKIRAEAQSQIQQFLATVDKPASVTLTPSFGLGLEIRTILDWQTRGKHDLIVMGRNGRSGLSRVLLGSVTDGVIRRAACPVLTIGDPEV